MSFVETSLCERLVPAELPVSAGCPGEILTGIKHKKAAVQAYSGLFCVADLFRFALRQGVRNCFGAVIFPLNGGPPRRIFPKNKPGL